MSRGSLIAYADGPAGLPLLAPDALGEMVGLENPKILLGWTLTTPQWLVDIAPGRATTFMAGHALRGLVDARTVRYLPIRLSSVPSALRRLRPDVVAIRARPRGDGFTYASSVGWAHAAALHSSAVVILLDELAPDLGGPQIPGRIAAVAECDFADALPSGIPDEAELSIGAAVAELVPEGATVQYGPGTIGAACVRSLRRPVSVWSGLITDDVVDLHRRGLLAGPATCAYLWGTSELTSLAESDRVRVRPVEQTHDLGRLARTTNFVAINTALQVGLDGAVNVERIAGRIVAGMGGHPDFCTGASLAPGGISVIALKSQRRGMSSIVHEVETVSTSRADVDVVVTEHGVADLRGLDDADRARRLIEIAAPEHRDALRDS